MQNRRLLFSVIIKLLTFSGLILLIVVFVNSLFSSNEIININNKEELPNAVLDISEMYKGQIKTVRWNNKEVAVLLRQFPEKLGEIDKVSLVESHHPSIKPQLRSVKPEYFVYYNIGDSKNCPLYYAAGIFKDVCSSNRFDEAGRDIKANLQSYMLEVPPHHFEKENLIFGQWKPE